MKKKTWIWLLIVSIALFVANIICSIVFRSEAGANIFTTISGWVSGIATIVLGLIAVWQNRKYKEENDAFLKEQNDLAWKNNYADMYKRFSEQLNASWNELRKYSPSKLKACFLKKLKNSIYSEFDILTSEYSGAFVNFIVSLRTSFFVNEFHVKLYDTVELFNYYNHCLMDYLDSLSSNRAQFDNETYDRHLGEALKRFNVLHDAVNTYLQKINMFLFDMYDMEILDLKNSAKILRAEQKEWYNRIKTVDYTWDLIKRDQEQNNG